MWFNNLDSNKYMLLKINDNGKENFYINVSYQDMIEFKIYIEILMIELKN